MLIEKYKNSSLNNSFNDSKCFKEDNTESLFDLNNIDNTPENCDENFCISNCIII